MKYKLVKVTRHELAIEEILAIEKDIYSVIGDTPVGYRKYIVRMTEEAYLEKKDGVLKEITPVRIVNMFLMHGNASLIANIRNKVKYRMYGFQVKLGW